MSRQKAAGSRDDRALTAIKRCVGGGKRCVGGGVCYRGFPRMSLLGNRMNKEEAAFSALSRKLCWSVDPLLLLLAKERNQPLTRLLPTLLRHSLPTARQAGGQRSSPPQPKVALSFQAG